ncbi:NAD-dependent epimerase/dehydratase family protein [Tsukamurella sp. 8F]|uniref:NAD-dependent epimerase/dehydratase family protein n=1 Tax=unclassified Tsukamurella TaxID=2633480 RepID=UPI0023B97762|nr:MULTISPECIES: NAD-dependent epimerase/dehydratase family protein [unclassified Tsukamurella]MDF0530718.1 NAD-dependent epimerase/dehydratase family protein [Tsukamurella sp. 8J]MDF0587919.1 NAD-dependent epimerase/dehydratase family protein [Tsukamurella sp. 8F]
MRIAVTGAAGYVGGNLIGQLVAEGHEVIAVDRIRGRGSASGDVRWVCGDVLDRASMRSALDGADVVFHLAAAITLRMEDERAWNLNTCGVATVARAAHDVGVRRLVHLSSVHAFDQDRASVMNERTPRSHRPGIPVYDRSKWAGEQELHKVVAEGLDAVICNPTGIWGPCDHGTPLSRLNGLARSAALGRVPVFIGRAGFDLVDVRDVVTGLLAAAEKGRTGENYLLGGEYRPLIDFMRLAAVAAGRRGPLVGLPLKALKAAMPVLEPLGARFDSDILSKGALGPLLASPLVDCSKARRELGYHPRPMEDSARDLVAFLDRAGRLGA